MGVDTVIRLPQNVRVRDVANVMGILAGKEAVKRFFQNSSSYSVDVKGVNVKAIDITSLVEIDIRPPFSEAAGNARLVHNKDTCAYVLFNYEGQFKNQSYFMMSPRSTPFWIAIGIGLVDFFGGNVDYNDCDSKSINYRRPFGKNINNCPEDGTAWKIFQDRLLALKPLAQEDFDYASRYATYNEEYRKAIKIKNEKRIKPNSRIQALEV